MVIAEPCNCRIGLIARANLEPPQSVLMLGSEWKISEQRTLEPTTARTGRIYTQVRRGIYCERWPHMAKTPCAAPVPENWDGSEYKGSPVNLLTLVVVSSLTCCTRPMLSCNVAACCRTVLQQYARHTQVLFIAVPAFGVWFAFESYGTVW